MASLADRWHSAILKNSLDIMRYDAGLRTEILAMLNQLGRDLVAEIAGAGLDTPRTDWQRARLRELIKAAHDRVGTAYNDIATAHADGMAGMAEASSGGLLVAMNDAVGFDLLSGIKWTPEQLAALVDGSMINGAAADAWWARQSVDLQQAFSDQMTQGMLRGETVTQLRDRIMGQNLPGVDAAGKVDLRTVAIEDRGLIQTARRNAESLVRTAAMSVNNSAHMALYEANSDVIAELSWVATLDLRTCLVAGTPVDTPEGETPIEALGMGDLVIGGSGTHRQVEATMNRKVTRTLKITLSNGETIRCTPDHKWLLDGQNWVEAESLKAGDVLASALK